MAEDFAIPQAKGMFDEAEPVPMGQLVVTAVNEAGDSAVNVLLVETDESGAFVAELTPEEADTYGQDLLNGGEDVRGLLVGRFDGETAIEDAYAEADELNANAPAPDAADEEKAAAAMDAKGVPEAPVSEDEKPMLDQFAEYPEEDI